MTTTSEPAATAGALPLTTFQRIMLRDLLHESWRAHVVSITNLAVRFHTREEPAVAARLAAVRRQLVDVESALERLDSGSYGRCDGCERASRSSCSRRRRTVATACAVSPAE